MNLYFRILTDENMPTRKFILSNDSFAEQPASCVRLERYEKDLNAAQLEAVRTTQGAVLAIAGAGTGKTKTLTYRVAYLIEAGVPAQSILLLTFTRRAAEEMMNRAAALAGVQSAQILGGTFHAYAHKLLRQYGSHIKLADNFTVLDQSDAEDVIDIVRTALGYHKKTLTQKRFPKKIPFKASLVQQRIEISPLRRFWKRVIRTFCLWLKILRK
ncbi:MAG: hypothetical protein CMR00_08445 [[Chlorobium] sp. 445]|nr:MAG: hypothetical protein CMR00_08445 [[Chlorobium] sp. 445]